MATLSLTEGGEGLPLQLTTITVAVPASPLSPNTGSMLGVAGVSGQVTPLTVPVSMTDTNFKWKYEQPKTDKAGTTLVSCREFLISTIMYVSARPALHSAVSYTPTALQLALFTFSHYDRSG